MEYRPIGSDGSVFWRPVVVAVVFILLRYLAWLIPLASDTLYHVSVRNFTRSESTLALDKLKLLSNVADVD